MTPRDLSLMIFINLIWASNNIVSKLVLSTMMVPPLAYTVARFAIVLAITLPWLRPLPNNLGRVLLIAVLMGPGAFGLNFIGFASSSPSTAAVVVQAGVPITTLLSVMMLGEKIYWRRILGITLALAGVLVVIYRPGFTVSTGLLFVLASAAAGALGAVLMKQMDTIGAMRFQAWVALASVVLLTPVSAVTEPGAWDAMLAAGWPYVIALVYSAVAVSVFAHTVYYWLIARYEANLIAPLTLLTPVATIPLGMAFTGDQLDARIIAGSALALLGVLIVAVRRTGAPVPQAQEHS
jgi:drug/metabolite transporter (DMT)-like permease